MICQKGSECSETTHEVKTMAAAIEWFTGVTEDDLPITVNQIKSIEGRLMIKVYSNDKRLIHRRG